MIDNILQLFTKEQTILKSRIKLLWQIPLSLSNFLFSDDHFFLKNKMQF